MATRRRTPSNVVKTPGPRSQVSIGRTKMYGPTTTRTVTVDPTTGEVTTEITVDTKQKVTVGSLVMLRNERRSTATVPSSMYSEVSPEWIQYVPSETQQVSINRQYGHDVLYVTAVSPDGKVFAARQVISERYAGSSGIGRIRGTLNIQEEAYRFREHHRDDDGNQLQGPPSPFMSTIQLNDGIRNSIVDVNPTTIQWCRASHITKVIDPAAISQRVWDTLKLRAKLAIRANLFNKLKPESKPWRRWGLFDGDHSYYHRRYVSNQRSSKVSGHGTSQRLAYLFSAAKKQGELTQTDLVALRQHLQTIRENIFTYGACHRRSVETTDAINARILARISAITGKTLLRGSCGHFHTDTTVRPLRVATGSDATTHLCPTCYTTRARQALTQSGETHWFDSSNVPVYDWSDGIARTWREPDVIGQRHSGKGVVGYVPPLSGVARAAVITCGLELEIQAVEYNKRNAVAHQLRNKLRESNLLDDTRLRKYFHMEHDGSTGEGGFEIVTGYTDRDTHEQLLKALLTNPDGSNAWSGKLLGHDARGQACGIHVHVQKPTSLIHATKMRQFVNASTSEKLVRAVARRYDNTYCRFTRDGAAPATNQAVKLYKDNKSSWTGNTGAVRSALMRINSGSRYEALNFQNSATVEFRIFRSSTKFSTVMACIEFSLAVWRFARDTKAELMNVEAFLRYLERPEQRSETRYLRMQLKARGFNVYVPNPSKVSAPVEETETI